MVESFNIWTNTPEVTFTLYRAQKRSGAFMVVFPGGGYRHHAAHENEPVCRWLNTLGIHAAAVTYRVFPNQHPLPLQDAARALRFVRHHAAAWGVDPNRVGVLGFSAGGHLAASISTLAGPGTRVLSDAIDQQDDRPNAAVLCYPVIDLASSAAHVGSAQALLGESPDPGMLEKMSMQNAVNANTPPTFLFHTADDAAVPVENAMLYASALRRHGVGFELHVYRTGRHGVGLADGSSSVNDPVLHTWTARCADWLTAIGFVG